MWGGGPRLLVKGWGGGGDWACGGVGQGKGEVCVSGGKVNDGKNCKISQFPTYKLFSHSFLTELQNLTVCLTASSHYDKNCKISRVRSPVSYISLVFVREVP